MPTYYCMTLDAHGQSFSAKVDAADPEAVVLEARGRGLHVAMVYRRDELGPCHVLPLMDNWNWPVPVRLRKRLWRRKPDGLSWFIDKYTLDAAIKLGRIQGRVGWFASEAVTRTVLDAIGRAAAEVLFSKSLPLLAWDKPPDLDGFEQERWKALEDFRRFTRVELPAEGLLPWVSIAGLDPEAALMWQTIPWACRDDSATLLAGWPVLIASRLGDFEAILGRRIEVVRCDEDPNRNHFLVERMLSRLFPGRFTLSDDSSIPLTKERQLPEESRVAVFFDSLEVVLSLKDPPALLLLARMMITEACKLGFRQLHLRPAPLPCRLSYAQGDRKVEVEELPRGLYLPLLVLLAAAVGIHPTDIPPARGCREIEVAGRKYRLRGRSRLTDEGESLEVEWAPA
ncbi:MAG: hypothetical protein HYZ53_30040 [Planctomycetes bacterium]|nr:hypothetical protein [Planctomycetota bacterium]